MKERKKESSQERKKASRKKQSNKEIKTPQKSQEFESPDEKREKINPFRRALNFSSLLFFLFGVSFKSCLNVLLSGIENPKLQKKRSQMLPLSRVHSRQF